MSVDRRKQSESKVAGIAKANRTGNWFCKGQAQAIGNREWWLRMAIAAVADEMGEFAVHHFFTRQAFYTDGNGQADAGTFGLDLSLHGILATRMGESRSNEGGSAFPYHGGCQCGNRLAFHGMELAADKIQRTPAGQADNNVGQIFSPGAGKALERTLGQMIEAGGGGDENMVEASITIKIERDVAGMAMSGQWGSRTGISSGQAWA